MVATSAGARLTLASLVVTSTFPLVVARVPCTVLPSARTTWTGLSALTDSTWSQDVVTQPTWSAHAALTARQTSKDKDRILILLSIIVGHALLSGIGSFRRVARCSAGNGSRESGLAGNRTCSPSLSGPRGPRGPAGVAVCWRFSQPGKSPTPQ